MCKGRCGGMETHVSLECGAEFATHAAMDEHVQRRAYGAFDNERAGWAGLEMSVVQYGVSDNGEPRRARADASLGCSHKLSDARVLRRGGDVPSVLGAAKVDALDIAVGDGTRLLQRGSRGYDRKDPTAARADCTVLVASCAGVKYEDSRLDRVEAGNGEAGFVFAGVAARGNDDTDAGVGRPLDLGFGKTVVGNGPADLEQV